MKIEVNITKTKFFAIIGAIILLIFTIMVHAYNSAPANPSIFGHSADEIDIRLNNGSRISVQNLLANGGGGGSGFGHSIVLFYSSAFTDGVSGCLGSCTKVSNGNYRWTAPEGVTSVNVKVGGGGGGGPYCSDYINCSGGGSGGYAESYVNVVPGSVYTISVGVGGNKGSPSNIWATSGGKSTFGNIVNATGGVGGYARTCTGGFMTPLVCNPSTCTDANGGTGYGAIRVSGHTGSCDTRAGGHGIYYNYGAGGQSGPNPTAANGGLVIIEY